MILFVFPSILRKLRLTCRTQDAVARGWLGRRRGQDAGRTRALCGPDAGRADARRGPDAGRRSAKLFLGGTVLLYFPSSLYPAFCFQGVIFFCFRHLQNDKLMTNTCSSCTLQMTFCTLTVPILCQQCLLN